jgi:hypothetical protein
MTKAFKVGDRVSWNSEAGRVSGASLSDADDRLRLNHWMAPGRGGTSWTGFRCSFSRWPS